MLSNWLPAHEVAELQNNDNDDDDGDYDDGDDDDDDDDDDDEKCWGCPSKWSSCSVCVLLGNARILRKVLDT